MRSTATLSFRRSAIVSWIKAIPALLVLFVVGCRSGTLPDPNDVAAAGTDTPQVIQAQLQNASDSFMFRKGKGEIDTRVYVALMERTARYYISQAKDKTITPENAAAWGDVYTTAHMWPEAEQAYSAAVKTEAGPSQHDFIALGQWVGDSMHLARAESEQGKIEDAIATTRSTFSCLPKAKAPILPAVLYEIVPPAVGKGHDFELANLLKDAIAQHEEVLVDPNSQGGRDFLLARPHHIERAWTLAAFLYKAAGRADLAAEAAANAQRMSQQNVQI